MQSVYRPIFTILTLFLLVQTATAQNNSPRADILLGGPDKNWTFIRQDIANASASDFRPDMNDWQLVSIPHTWNNLDGQDGGNGYYRGTAWYIKSFTIPPELAGRCYFLKFEGAATTAEVFINGKSAGKHAGNFAAFCFDITPMVNATGTNNLAVKVNNAASPDITPVSGDFTIFGGIYRPVHLLALDPLSISPLDYASPGVYLKQTRVTRQQATVDVTIKLRNAFKTDKTATVTTILMDPQQKEIQRLSKSQPVPQDSVADAAQQISIPNPVLWNGLKDAAQYQVIIEVRDGDRLTDRITQPLGLRFFSADPDRGFLLNGQSYPLHGVNMHQDRLDKGWAATHEDLTNDFTELRKFGVTALRCAHYQHNDYTYELADRDGIAIWAELSIVDRFGPNNNSAPTEAFRQNARQQLTELIKQNYNHPSILMWSLYNEIRLEQRAVTPGPRIWDLIGELNALAHDLDPTRFTVCASLQTPDHPVNFFTDILAINWYYGWYGGQPADWGPALDKLHAALPTRCLGISEYGAGASLLHHQIPPTQPNPGGPFHPEEWQSLLHEQAWFAMKARPWLWGTFLWNMFDFASDGRREGDTPGRNDKGLITYDRKTKKDAYYFYQSQWTTEPMVHITSQRYTPRPLPNAPVKIYSNAPTVDLLVNGKSVGSKTSDNGIFIWDNATLNPGPNSLEARASKGPDTVSNKCTITLDPTLSTTQPFTGPIPPSLSAPPLTRPGR